MSVPASAHNISVHTVTTRDKGNGVTEAFMTLRYDLACGRGDDPMLLSIKGADKFVKQTTMAMMDKEMTRHIENERDGAKAKVKELQERVDELTREQIAITAFVEEEDEDDEVIGAAIAVPIEQQSKTDELPEARPIKSTKKKTNKSSWCVIS